MPRERTVSLRYPIICVSILALYGCGKSESLERFSVSGTVNVDGQPLSEGRISFLPSAGTNGPTAGGSVQAGKFNIPRNQGPAAGKYRVEIISFRPTGKTVIDDQAADSNSQPVAVTEQFLPSQYNEKSTLTADIDKSTASKLSYELVTSQPSPKK